MAPFPFSFSVGFLYMLIPQINSLQQFTFKDHRHSFIVSKRGSPPLFVSSQAENNDGIIEDMNHRYQLPLDQSRRHAAVTLLTSSLLCTTTSFLFNPSVASAINNPLNLKGTYWETGELYKKSDNTISPDPDELLDWLRSAAKKFQSLSEVAENGRFEELSRLLRGGAVSESQLRLRAYALIDLIEDEDKEYMASTMFRTFLNDFEFLDRTVNAASRQSQVDGGVTKTLGLAVVSPFGAANEVARISSEPYLGGDARINILASLGKTTKALEAFNKVAGEAFQVETP